VSRGRTRRAVRGGAALAVPSSVLIVSFVVPPLLCVPNVKTSDAYGGFEWRR